MNSVFLQIPFTNSSKGNAALEMCEGHSCILSSLRRSDDPNVVTDLRRLDTNKQFKAKPDEDGCSPTEPKGFESLVLGGSASRVWVDFLTFPALPKAAASWTTSGTSDMLGCLLGLF